ncbi:MAG: aspartate kinase [Chloroflexi bacterium]|nr:aspartate kinase [Chloroflexota bacterium]
MTTLVMKFGGAALGTASGLNQVLSIIAQECRCWDRVMVVVSALDGVTDMLLDAAHYARIDQPRGYRRIAANLRTRHLAMVDQAPLNRPDRNTLQADIDKLLSGLLDDCQAIANKLSEELSPVHLDALVAVGERLSARIIAALLRQKGIRAVAVDGTDLLVTDEVHGNANPVFAPTAQKAHDTLTPMLQRDMAPVITGYIGATSRGATTTLGRGGTDYTASVLSSALGADELQIWTDVDGMMTADPRAVTAARVIPRLSYDEAADLAYFGARILHARMIAPLAETGMPLRIKNIFSPQQAGTLVSSGPDADESEIKAVTATLGLSLRRPASGSLAGVTRLVGKTLLESLGMRSDVLIASQSAGSSFVCLVIPTSIGFDGVEGLQRALRTKMAEYPEKMPWSIEAVSLVTAIGSSLHRAPNLVSRVLEALDEFEILGMALGASNCSVTLALAQQDSRAAVARIHELIVRNDSDNV